MGRKIQKIKAFFTGWFLMLVRHDNPEAKRRRNICRTCEFRKGYRCGVCGCPLKAMSLAGDNNLCHKGKWNI